MRARLLSAIVACSFAAAAGAQSPSTGASSTKDAQTKKPAPKSITLTGCVTPDLQNAGQFAIVDLTTGQPTYRLAGTDVRQYLGKRVQIVGTPVEPKVKIIGGLTPNPNVAAQAGAIDPTRAAMANQGAEGNAKPGNIEVPQFQVKSVRAVAGTCGPERE
jgi:hypothetical protein